MGGPLVWTTSAYRRKHCTGRYQDTREYQVEWSTKSELEERSQQRPTKDGVHLGGRWQLLTDTVQSRFAETRLAETLTLNPMPNPNRNPSLT